VGLRAGMLVMSGCRYRGQLLDGFIHLCYFVQGVQTGPNFIDK